MATIGHVAAGIALGRISADRPGALLAVTVLVAAVLPDVDFLLRIDHRGPTHSIGMAVAAGTLVYAGFRALGRSDAAAAAILSACAVLSHILLDMLTAHQPVAALWPLTRAEFSLESRWLPAAPTDAALFTVRGAVLLLGELAWSAAVILTAIVVRRSRASPSTDPAAPRGR